MGGCLRDALRVGRSAADGDRRRGNRGARRAVRMAPGVRHPQRPRRRRWAPAAARAALRQCRTRAPPARHPLTPSPRATRSRGARPAGGGEQTATSPAFGGDGFEFRVRLNLQPRVGRSVEISLLLEPASDTVRTLQGARSLFFSLTIRNQKDDHLSITMDEEREVDAADPAQTDLADFGFHHFMTFDLLMDTSAGYLSSEGVVISAHVRMTAHRNDPAASRPSGMPAGLTVPHGSPASSSPSLQGHAPAAGCVMVRVACEDDLRRHVGPWLVDFGAVHEFVVPEHMRADAFRCGCPCPRSLAPPPKPCGVCNVCAVGTTKPAP